MHLELETIHEKCGECSRIKVIEANGESRTFCIVYKAPSIWWDRYGGCPMCTTKRKVVVQEKKMNPLKASKKARKVRK